MCVVGIGMGQKVACHLTMMQLDDMQLFIPVQGLWLRQPKSVNPSSGRGDNWPPGGWVPGGCLKRQTPMSGVIQLVEGGGWRTPTLPHGWGSSRPQLVRLSP